VCCVLVWCVVVGPWVEFASAVHESIFVFNVLDVFVGILLSYVVKLI
jgi:hypothetical protein